MVSLLIRLQSGKRQIRSHKKRAGLLQLQLFQQMQLQRDGTPRHYRPETSYILHKLQSEEHVQGLFKPKIVKNLTEIFKFLNMLSPAPAAAAGNPRKNPRNPFFCTIFEAAFTKDSLPWDRCACK